MLAELATRALAYRVDLARIHDGAVEHDFYVVALDVHPKVDRSVVLVAFDEQRCRLGEPGVQPCQ